MSRRSINIFRRGDILYARWYDSVDGKRIVLSLDTGDQKLAEARLPWVQQNKLSYSEYNRASEKHGPESRWPSLIIEKIDNVVLASPKKYTILPDRLDSLEGLIKRAAENGISIKLGLADGRGVIIQPIAIGNENNLPAIRDFYNTAVPAIFVDKKSANRNATIWLEFLDIKEITSWSQITDALLQDFRAWRENTARTTPNHPNRKAKKPSSITVTRHLQFLKKSFDLAVNRGYMPHNVLLMTKMNPYLTPEQDFLTLTELKKVLIDPSWNDKFLQRGVNQLPMLFSWGDILKLLFVSCKRRSEITKLKIENVNYKHHFAYYKEEKNRSKSGVGSIGKAFWLTPGMEKLLKRVIGERQDGYVFSSPIVDDNDTARPINSDLISARFDEIAKRIAPKKHVTLKNLRQTAHKIMEDAGLSDAEIDATLGHVRVTTALPFYQDRSIESRGKRLSMQNKKGVETLCKAVKEFLD